MYIEFLIIYAALAVLFILLTVIIIMLAVVMKRLNGRVAARPDNGRTVPLRKRESPENTGAVGLVYCVNCGTSYDSRAKICPRCKQGR